MKALVITNQVRRIPGGFLESVVSPLLDNGYDVTWAANFSNSTFDIKTLPCSIINTKSKSNPFSIGAIKAYKAVSKFLKMNKVDLIFCSTPIGGLIGRLCGKKHKIKIVIYQAHGFLFFKGGPKLGFLYKFVEKWLAHFTDVLITINNEDFEQAKKFKLKDHSSLVFKVNGSGADYSSIALSLSEKNLFKESIGVKGSDYIFLSIGELNKNKNVINAVRGFNRSYLKDKAKLVVCGDGKQKKRIANYIKHNNLEKSVLLLGYRNDVKKIISVSDCYISTSYREGLSRTVGESLAAGLPCIVSNKRGLADWIEEGFGFLIEPNKVETISKAMNEVYNIEDISIFKKYGSRKVEQYSSNEVSKQMREMLKTVLTHFYL